jgi:hypothetical protein
MPRLPGRREAHFGNRCCRSNVFGFRDYIFTMIFNDRPIISFGARNIAKEMLTSLELPLSNTAGTLLVYK